MARSSIFALFILFELLSPAYGKEAVIGVFGDLHGHVKEEQRLLAQLKQNGVTHIIALGDYVLRGGPPELESVLSKLAPMTGVKKEKTFLLPGNWDQNSMPPKLANRILARYGRLVTELYYGYGIVTIDGEKMMVSHFPQHPLPDLLLPPKELIRAVPGQITLVETLLRDIYPSRDTFLEFFSHTHVGGAYLDPHSGKWAINPGVLDDRKRSDEPKAYVIYFQNRKLIRFVDVENGRSLLEVQLTANDVCVSGCSLHLLH